MRGIKLLPVLFADPKEISDTCFGNQVLEKSKCFQKAFSTEGNPLNKFKEWGNEQKPVFFISQLNQANRQLHPCFPACSLVVSCRLPTK